MYDTIAKLIEASERILIIQADNPDADSLGSALAVEQLLGELGKQTYLFCGIDIPKYLRYLEGWSRVSSVVPPDFDLSIIVDASAMSLFQKLSEPHEMHMLSKKPCVILDHHADTDNNIHFATEVINRPELSSTGELVFDIAISLGWKIDITSANAIAVAILGDTQGLSNENASASTYRAMASLIDIGLDRPRLEDLRRELSRMDPKIFKYKAVLIDRTEFLADGKIALVTIAQQEINTYSPLYNPAPLIQQDMLQTADVQIAIVLKRYDDGKILASIRSNSGAPIAGALATHFGGGGHAHASGFKIIDGRPFNELRSECLDRTIELLDKLTAQKDKDETIQYAYSTD